MARPSNIVAFVRYLALFLVVLPVTARAHEAPDYRSHFFDEILTPEQTAWTHRFNAYEPTSYTVDKVELVRTLPAVARARGLALLGVLIVGPIGPLWSYHVVTFVRQGERVRVVAVAFPHARLVHKSTGSLGSEEYVELSQSLFQVGESKSVRDVDELGRELERRARRDQRGLPAEWQANFVFASYDPPRVAYGAVEKLTAELDGVVAPLLRSLRRTYGHGQRVSGPSRRADRSFAFWLLADMTTEPVPELDRAIAPFGFAGFDDTVLSLGIGGDVMLWRGVRVGYDITYGVRRAEHRTLDAEATWSTARLSPRVGFDLARFDGFSLSAGLGLRWDARILDVDASALPGSHGDDLRIERNGLGAELSVLAEYYLARTRTFGLLVGTRIGAARGLTESDFPPGSVAGNPATLSRGAFGSLHLGAGGGF